MSWLLYFHVSISCLSLSPLRLKHLLSGRGLGRRHDALAAAWLAHFKADLSSRSEPDLEYFLTALLHLCLHPVCFSLSQKEKNSISPPDSEVSLNVCQTAQDCLQISPPSVDTFSHDTAVDERTKMQQSVIMVCKNHYVLLKTVTRPLQGHQPEFY